MESELDIKVIAAAMALCLFLSGVLAGWSARVIIDNTRAERKIMAGELSPCK